jgi:hypothetical protein
MIRVSLVVNLRVMKIGMVQVRKHRLPGPVPLLDHRIDIILHHLITLLPRAV